MQLLLNKHKLKIPFDHKTMIYIGRTTGDRNKHFGNPFTHLSSRFTDASLVVKTRVESITSFREWLDGTNHHDIEPERREWILNNLDLLRGKDLICWCSPAPCHGEVYLELLSRVIGIIV